MNDIFQLKQAILLDGRINIIFVRKKQIVYNIFLFSTHLSSSKGNKDKRVFGFFKIKSKLKFNFSIIENIKFNIYDALYSFEIQKYWSLNWDIDITHIAWQWNMHTYYVTLFVSKTWSANVLKKNLIYFQAIWQYHH